MLKEKNNKKNLEFSPFFTFIYIEGEKLPLYIDPIITITSSGKEEIPMNKNALDRALSFTVELITLNKKAAECAECIGGSHMRL